MSTRMNMIKSTKMHIPLGMLLAMQRPVGTLRSLLCFFSVGIVIVLAIVSLEFNSYKASLSLT
jgi:hypothetical protein